MMKSGIINKKALKLQSRPAEWHLMFKIIAVENIAAILSEIYMIASTLQLVIIHVSFCIRYDEIFNIVIFVHCKLF